MIITGALRSIIVKLAYQSGFRAPLTITLLYLFGKSLSLLVYWMQQVIMDNEKWLWKNEYDVLQTMGAKDDDTQQTKEETSDSNIELTECEQSSSATAFEVTKEQSSCEEAPDNDDMENNFLPTTDSIAMEATEQLTITKSSIHVSSIPSYNDDYNEEDDEIPNGSNHGLSPQSTHRIRWAHTIPYHIRPCHPCTVQFTQFSILRWASLVYIDASVAEMFISGLELTLSVVLRHG